MFGLRQPPRYRIDTLIGAGTRIVGDLQFSGGLRIDGEVLGNVIAAPGEPSVLVIGEQGKVQGEVRAARMVVNGVVSGAIHATELLELQPCARVAGELRYAALEVHHGALLEVALTREANVVVAAPQTPAAKPQPAEPIAPGTLPAPSAA
jgi:cytoskeletal protein CcmA (bactofilin family)